MDPSEFEGTVEKNEGFLDAGPLELLLQTQGPKFTLIDLSKEIGDLYLSIYSLKELISKCEVASLVSMTKEMDEAAEKLAELKESYVGRRRVLTQQVKKFTMEYLNDAGDGNPMVEACKEVIDLFKREFDGLSSMSKFSETSFLGIYKAIRDLPDPAVVASEGLSACLKANEILGKAQDQLNVANEIINATEANTSAAAYPSTSTAIKQAELEKLQQQLEMDKEELKQSYLNEIVNVRAKYDVEMRNRELSLTSIFEKQQTDLQRQMEGIISKSESEVASLLRSLNENQLKNQELDERAKLLDAEMVRRRDLEEKWRSSVVKISDLTSANQELSSNLEKTQVEVTALKSKLETSLRAAEKSKGDLSKQLSSVQSKLTDATAQLASRPPVDLQNLINSIGSIATVEQERLLGDRDLSWTELEAFIVESIRKSEAEATQGRIRLQETNKQVSDLQAQCNSLQHQLATQVALTTSLERDLLHAHQVVHSGAARPKTQAKKLSAADSNAHLETLISGSGERSRPASAAGDIEAASLTENSSSGDLGGEQSGYNLNDRILVAVQSQRDRYMKAAKEKDGELVEVKAKLDRLGDEQLQLRNENLELYRRLRVLRVSNSASQGGSGSASSGGSGGSESMAGPAQDSMRSRRQMGSDSAAAGNDELNLDEKYMSLYQAEISPFRVEEIDRQLMLSRLNFFERGLAYVNRYVLQDRWARHALMVYLALVHILALIYISQVLNPQLIDEVDAHMKAKWSAETFEMQEHPDN